MREEIRPATPREARRGIVYVAETPTATWEIDTQGTVERIGPGGRGHLHHRAVDPEAARTWLAARLADDSRTAARMRAHPHILSSKDKDKDDGKNLLPDNLSQ